MYEAQWVCLHPHSGVMLAELRWGKVAGIGVFWNTGILDQYAWLV